MPTGLLLDHFITVPIAEIIARQISICTPLKQDTECYAKATSLRKFFSWTCHILQIRPKKAFVCRMIEIHLVEHFNQQIFWLGMCMSITDDDAIHISMHCQRSDRLKIHIKLLLMPSDMIHPYCEAAWFDTMWCDAIQYGSFSSSMIPWTRLQLIQGLARIGQWQQWWWQHRCSTRTWISSYSGHRLTETGRWLELVY